MTVEKDPPEIREITPVAEAERDLYRSALRRLVKALDKEIEPNDLSFGFQTAVTFARKVLNRDQ
jgi:6-phosphofructokinase